MSTTLSRVGARLLVPALAASLLAFAPSTPAQADRFYAPAPGTATDARTQERLEDRRNASKASQTSKKNKKRAALGERAIRAARTRAGRPYVYGAAGPGAFDCSGLVQWSFRKAGKNLPRTSGAQVGATRRVAHPRRGDLVFFTNGGSVYHVGIYAGNNTLWHSSRPGTPVRKDRIWTSSVFYGRVR